MALDWPRKPNTSTPMEKSGGMEKASERTTSDFESGAQRSGALSHLDYTSIHPIAMIALARVLGGEGSVKYGRCEDCDRSSFLI